MYCIYVGYFLSVYIDVVVSVLFCFNI